MLDKIAGALSNGFVGFLVFAFFVKIDEKAHARIVTRIERNMHADDGSAKYGKEIAKATLLGKDLKGDLAA